MRHLREESIRCVCGWQGRGYGGDLCPRCGSTERLVAARIPTALDPALCARLVADVPPRHRAGGDLGLTQAGELEAALAEIARMRPVVNAAVASLTHRQGTPSAHHFTQAGQTEQSRLDIATDRAAESYLKAKL